MAPRYSEIIKSLGKDRLKLNEPMAKHTTFGIGGPADLFYEARTKEELVKAMRLARKLKIPYFILGAGSNLLVSDKGIRGLVIKVGNGKWEVKGEKIIADAGASLAKLVETAVKHSLSGVEICFGIPGTVGGAVVGNAGTADKWIEDIIEEVEVLDKEGKIHQLSSSECQFGYRTSRFKQTKEIILRVILVLKKDEPEKIKERMKAIVARRRNQPKERSAGSIFKNPVGKSAGWLIEQVGLKGKRVGDAQISPQHANFIVNKGAATADDVVQLIKLIKREVKKKFGIELEEEICLIGFDRM